MSFTLRTICLLSGSLLEDLSLNNIYCGFEAKLGLLTYLEEAAK